MTTDQWLLALTALASVGGVTGVWLLYWAWTDRPQHGWNFRLTGDAHREVRGEDGSVAIVPIDVNERHKTTLEIKSVSTAAHVVEVRFVGCTVVDAPDGYYAPTVLPGSDPLVFKLSLPDAARGVAWAEIVWLQRRPRRYRGLRMDLRTQSLEDWRWYWRSLRRRGRRLIRTTGRWVARKNPPLPEIPPT